MSAVERTLVLLKPDAVERGLVGRIISRYEDRGLGIVAAELVDIDEELAAQHYAEHVGREFYQRLENFIVSGPVLAMILEGPGAIDAVRTMNGATNSLEAAAGTIRGDFGLDTTRNLVHASADAAVADREIGLWFPELQS